MEKNRKDILCLIYVPFAMFFVAPFSLLAFLYAFFVKLPEWEEERKRGR